MLVAHPIKGRGEGRVGSIEGRGEGEGSERDRGMAVGTGDKTKTSRIKSSLGFRV